MKIRIVLATVVLVSVVNAEPAAKNMNFIRQQAQAELQRVTAQMDVLSENVESMNARVAKVEAQKKEIESLKAEVEALKGVISQLRNDLNQQHSKIVDDLSKKIVKLQPASSGKSSGGPSGKPAPDENCGVYEVQSGDNLFLIARACGTTVAKLKQINGLKDDKLSIGQKIYFPKPKD